MEELFKAADRAIADGTTILILSDKGVDRTHAPIRRCWDRPGCIIILSAAAHAREWGWYWNPEKPREVHHFCLLLGYGVQAINPYLAYECLNDMIHEGMLKGITYHEAVKGYDKAVYKGVVKVMAKMGISTIQSPLRVQIFSRLWGWGSRAGGQVLYLDAVSRRRHRLGGNCTRGAAATCPGISNILNGHTLEVYGQYQYRKDGELHLFNPRTIHLLQKACRTNDYKTFKEFTQLIDVSPSAWRRCVG